MIVPENGGITIKENFIHVLVIIILFSITLIGTQQDIQIGTAASISNQPLPVNISPLLDSEQVLRKNFEFAPWGQYRFIEYLGEHYFAAYDSNVTRNIIEGQIFIIPISYLYDKSRKRNLVIHGQVSKVLIDDNGESKITADSPLKLKEGYEIIFKYFNLNKNKILLELRKNGQPVDKKILQPSIVNAAIFDKTYYYKKDLGNSREVVIIAVHLKDLFFSANEEGSIIDGIFQISDTPTPINFNPQWNQDIKLPETPSALPSSNTDKAWIKNFALRAWGQYWARGHPDDRYLIAYDGTVNKDMVNRGESVAFLFNKSENVNLSANGQMTKILMDNDTYAIITSNSHLNLKEGYELIMKYVSADEERVSLELKKDGKIVDSRTISPTIENATMNDKTYYFKRDVGETKGIVTIAVYLTGLFDGANEDCAIVKGIFQISDTPRPIKGVT